MKRRTLLAAAVAACLSEACLAADWPMACGDLPAAWRAANAAGASSKPPPDDWIAHEGSVRLESSYTFTAARAGIRGRVRCRGGWVDMIAMSTVAPVDAMREYEIADLLEDLLATMTANRRDGVSGRIRSELSLALAALNGRTFGGERDAVVRRDAAFEDAKLTVYVSAGGVQALVHPPAWLRDE